MRREVFPRAGCDFRWRQVYIPYIMFMKVYLRTEFILLFEKASQIYLLKN